MLRTEARRVGSTVVPWLCAGVLAVIAGAAAARAATAFVVGVIALLLVGAVWLWRSRQALVPFLLLVAAMQGGTLLSLSLDVLPIATLMPLFGGWAVLAVLFDREQRPTASPVTGIGQGLVPGLIALTASAQPFRGDGSGLSLTEMLTLVQLAVLVLLTAHLLTEPRRVLWMGYVTMTIGGLLSVITLLAQFGIASSWLVAVPSGAYARSSGLVGDPNYFSFQLLLALAFTVNSALTATTARGKLLFWTVFVVIFAAIVTTYSAGALVGLVAVVGATLLLQYKVSLKRALVAFTVIIAATVVVALVAPADYSDAVFGKYESGITGGSFERFGTGRGAAWEAAAREVADNPLLGVGLGGERVVRAIAGYYTFERVERKAAHNMYLGLSVGAGALGLAAFLVILLTGFAVLWKANARAAREGWAKTSQASASLFTALLVVATQGLTLSLELEKFTWLMVGACVAVRFWPAEEGSPQTHRQP